MPTLLARQCHSGGVGGVRETPSKLGNYRRNKMKIICSCQPCLPANATVEGLAVLEKRRVNSATTEEKGE